MTVSGRSGKRLLIQLLIKYKPALPPCQLIFRRYPRASALQVLVSDCGRSLHFLSPTERGTRISSRNGHLSSALDSCRPFGPVLLTTPTLSHRTPPSSGRRRPTRRAAEERCGPP